MNFLIQFFLGDFNSKFIYAFCRIDSESFHSFCHRNSSRSNCFQRFRNINSLNFDFIAQSGNRMDNSAFIRNILNDLCRNYDRSGHNFGCVRNTSANRAFGNFFCKFFCFVHKLGGSLNRNDYRLSDCIKEWIVYFRAEFKFPIAEQIECNVFFSAARLF